MPSVSNPRTGLSRLLALVLAVLLVSLVVMPASGAAAQDPRLPSVILDDLEIDQALRPARLESSLAQLASVRAREGTGAAREFGDSRMLDVEADSVVVMIQAQLDQANGVEGRLQAIGAKSTGSYEDLIRAEVPIDKLVWLSCQPEVAYVRPPRRPTLMDPVSLAEDVHPGFGVEKVTLTAPEDVVSAAVAPDVVSQATTLLLDDGFESWPGPWSTSGAPTWGRTTYRASSGSYSVYCAGSSISAPGPYANNMEAWLTSGPYDLSAATTATLDFDYWLSVEEGFDELFVGASSDGSSYTGITSSVDSSGWQSMSLDLTGFTGDSSVWIAFMFMSDYSVMLEGAYIDEVTLSISDGVYTSEGVAETNADVIHAGGIDGTGVKIGIIDGGFFGYAAKLGTELPDSVTCWGGSALGPEGNGSEVHGTAVAETVHDMAPGASLYLAQFSDVVDLSDAAAWMVAQGVDVINMSAGWIGVNPGDGTGAANDVVSSTVAAGVFWANSAGNSRENHWMGDFVDVNTNGFLEWTPGVEVQRFNALAGQPVEGVLSWDDDWTAPTQDYDLGLFYWNGVTWDIVAWSNSMQNGTPGQWPIEGLSGVLGDDGTYAWVVLRHSATRADVDFDFFDNYRSPEYQVHARSICSPADNAAEGFMPVGAVGRSPGFTQESYSSEGPTRDERLVPEISAPASTSNSVYEQFAGTSASSPHVAGAAALILQANPSYTPVQMESHLEGDAIDLGDAGPDTQYGYGRLLVDVSADDIAYIPLSGSDRYETAAVISAEAFPSGAGCVVIATGLNFPDALGGAALAGAKGGPILLSSTNDVPTVTMEEIDRLGATEAVILGGTGAVGSAAEAELVSAPGMITVTRIGGANRYETAQLVAQATITELGGTWDDTAFLATGSNFPDALAAAPIAAAQGWPIYLTQTAALGSTKSAMQSAGVDSVFILGGTGVVSLSVEADLKVTFGYLDVERLAGANRYATGVEIATYGVDHCGLTWDGVAFATGENFPDALSGGVLQGRDDSVMLLTSSSALSSEPEVVLQANKASITEVKFLGGIGAMSQAVRDQVMAALE